MFETVRFFERMEKGQPAYIKEVVTWLPTSDDDPRGVSLVGKEGKFIWQMAGNHQVVLPSNKDPKYWDYYNLPLAQGIVRQLTKEEYENIMLHRQNQLIKRKLA